MRERSRDSLPLIRLSIARLLKSEQYTQGLKSCDWVVILASLGGIPVSLIQVKIATPPQQIAKMHVPDNIVQLIAS
jgi:hypothetical protein